MISLTAWDDEPARELARCMELVAIQHLVLQTVIRECEYWRRKVDVLEGAAIPMPVFPKAATVTTHVPPAVQVQTVFGPVAVQPPQVSQARRNRQLGRRQREGRT